MNLIQNNSEFDNFLLNFVKVSNKITNFNTFFTVIPGDLNAKSKTWCANYEIISGGTPIENLTSCIRFH